MKASDVAYIITLIQSDNARPELVKELQALYRITQSANFGEEFRVPVMSMPTALPEIRIKRG